MHSRYERTNRRRADQRPIRRRVLASPTHYGLVDDEGATAGTATPSLGVLPSVLALSKGSPTPGRYRVVRASPRPSCRYRPSLMPSMGAMSPRRPARCRARSVRANGRISRSTGVSPCLIAMCQWASPRRWRGACPVRWCDHGGSVAGGRSGAETAEGGWREEQGADDHPWAGGGVAGGEHDESTGVHGGGVLVRLGDAAGGVDGDPPGHRLRRERGAGGWTAPTGGGHRGRRAGGADGVHRGGRGHLRCAGHRQAAYRGGCAGHRRGRSPRRCWRRWCAPYGSKRTGRSSTGLVGRRGSPTTRSCKPSTGTRNCATV